MSDNINDIKEIRKLIIQNLNTLNSVEVSLKTITQNVTKKDRTEANRTFVMMILLGIVIITAFFFYFRSEVTRYKEKLANEIKLEEQLRKDIKELRDKVTESENNNIKAYNLYLALKEGDQDSAVKMYGDFNLSSLSRLERFIIEGQVNMIKQSVAMKKFEEGQTLFNRKSYLSAVEKFNESLAVSSTGKHIPTLFYLSSMSYYRVKDFSKAAISFERYLFVNTEKGLTRDKAELMLGVCYEKMKQYDRAVNFYNRVLTSSKNFSYKPTIRDRLKIMEKKLEKQRLLDEKKVE